MRARPERQFYFRLAGHLSMTVAELLARISSRELSEWMVYEQITGPLGGKRVDIAAALVAAVIANVNRTKGKAFEVADFLPSWGEQRAKQVMTPEQMLAVAKGITAGIAKRGG